MNEPNRDEQVDKSFSRINGEQCGGKCKHSSTYHLARIKNESGEYDLACCKVDCACMKFVASGIPNDDPR